MAVPRVMLLLVGALGGCAAAYLVDDAPGLGLRWEGVGAISGGGATTKLLKDYPAAAASSVLDFLFSPGFGLNLQILKVEIGGDTDATEGAEPSHMHSADDPPNFQRGYEWWLMKEAKRRNPGIKLYGLPWGWPGWLDPKATPDRQARNPFSDAEVTANYTVQWLEGALKTHGLVIDYVGQWNERDAPASYSAALRKAVSSSPELGGTTVLNRLPHYPGTTDVPDKQGCSQYQWNTTDGSRWVDEEGSIFDGRSARCLARCVNRNYISGCHTATFQWHLVSSFYDYLPWSRCGVAVANTPWSGHFEITSPTWALAHTSQFAPIGWRYSAHGHGCQMLSKGGSMVTRVSPDLKDFSIVVEKMQSASSTCARGSNPKSSASNETVQIQLKGSFLKAAAGRQLYLWSSDLSSADTEGVNPDPAKVFVLQAPVHVGADGLVTIQAAPDQLHTLTTLSTGSKGERHVPPAAPFPLPYTQHFDNENIGQPPSLWYDQMGAWEIQPDPSGGVSHGQVMRQVVPVWPACWGYSCSGPTTYFGPAQFNSSLKITASVRMEDHGSFTIGPDGPKGAAQLTVGTDGSWRFGKSMPGDGAPFDVNSWHRIEVMVAAGWQAASVDGRVLMNVTQDGPTGWRVKVALSRYVFCAIDDFEISRL